jgi:amino acid transporter
VTTRRAAHDASGSDPAGNIAITSDGQVGRSLRAAGLGTADLVFFVVAAAAPLTVVAGVVPLAIRTGGMSAAYGYLIPALVLLLFAVGFTAMSPLIRNAGAFYSYIAHSLGRRLAVGSALIAVVSYNAMTICLIAGFTFYAQSLLSSVVGVHISWIPLAVLAILGVAMLGYFKVTLGARILGIALGLEVLVLLIYEIVVIGKGGHNGAAFTVDVFAPSVLTHPGFGAMLVLTAGGFIGFEATALYAEEARDPARTVPRATYIAIGFLGLFYTFSVWCVFLAYGPDGALAVANGDDVSNLTFQSMGAWVGPWLSETAQALLCTSAFAAALAFHNAAARYHFTLSREKLLPGSVAYVSPAHGSPAGGVALQTVINVVVFAIAAVAGADPYLVVFLWSSAPGVLGILLLEGIAAVAIVVFFRRDRHGHSVWRTTVAPALAAIGLFGLVALSVSQIALLTGASGTTNVVLLAPIPIALVVGIGLATHFKRNRPADYAALTTLEVDR